jgi:cystathionine gamma-synthase
MVPIPADPQRDLEDESIAVDTQASSAGIGPLERLFWSLGLLGDGRSSSTPDTDAWERKELMTDHFSTMAVHAGEPKRKPYGALTTPIVQTSTYTFADTAEILDFMQRKADGASEVRDEYGRYSNPTQSVAEHKLAALEGGEQALLFASGMCAITTTILALLSAGEHLVLVSGVYRRTQDFVSTFLPRWGIEATVVPINDRLALAAAIRPTTRLIFAESPTNPYLRVVDLKHLVELATKHGIITAIDSTFATPINMRPLEQGLDLVIHSATKYLAGHNDLLAGVVIGSRDALVKIQEARGVLGGVSSPHDAYLLVRGLKTLDLRVRRQNENGLRIAQFLEGHPAIRRVYYPGLPSDRCPALGAWSALRSTGTWSRPGGLLISSVCHTLAPRLGEWKALPSSRRS